MAIKQRAVTADTTQFNTDITLQIDGLIATSTEGVFTLCDVPLSTNIDFRAIAEILHVGGVPQRDADELADEFADTVFVKQLSKILAQRARRA